MFEVILNGHSLDLAGGQQIELLSTSSFFTDAIEADGSELISFAITPRNLQAFGHIDVIELAAAMGSYDCLLRIGGNTYVATLRLQEITDAIRGYVLYNKQELTCLQKNCRDFDWDLNVGIAPGLLFSQFKDGTEKVWPETPFYFPSILNPEFYDDEDTDPASKVAPFFEGIINQSVYGSTQFLPVDNFLNASNEPNNRNTLVPMVSVLEIFRRALLSDGYTLTGEFASHPTIRRMFVYNSQSLDAVTTPGPAFYVFAGNPNGYPTGFAGTRINFTITSDTNIVNLASNEYEITQQGTFDVLIKFRMSNKFDVNNARLEVMRGSPVAVVIADLPFGGGNMANGDYSFKLRFTWFGADFGKKVWFRLQSQGGMGTAFINNIYVEFKQLIDKPLVSFNYISDLSPHVPNAQFSKLFNAFIQAFQLRVVVNREEKILSLDFRKSYLTTKNPTVYQTTLSRMRINIFLPSTYIYKWSQSINTEELIDAEVANQMILRPDGTLEVTQQLPDDLEATNITPELELLQRKVIEHPNYNAGARTLFIKARGTSAALGTQAGNEPLRVGVFQGNIGNNALADLAWGDLSLMVANNNFSIMQYVRPWLQFLQTNIREFELELPANHPMADTFSADQQIALRNNVFIIKEIKRTITTAARGVIVVKCRRI